MSSCDYYKARSERARAAGLCSRCARRPHRPGKAYCETCVEKLKAIRNRTREEAYQPLDELLETPRMRMLRFLSRCDWISAADIFDALDVSPDERLAYRQTLRTQWRIGAVERRQFDGEPGEYRITPKGRKVIEKVMQKYDRSLSGKEAA